MNNQVIIIILVTNGSSSYSNLFIAKTKKPFLQIESIFPIAVIVEKARSKRLLPATAEKYPSMVLFFFEKRISPMKNTIRQIPMYEIIVVVVITRLIIRSPSIVKGSGT